MSLRYLLILGITVIGTAVGAASAEGLKLGDPAPALKISEWVKGSAVDVEKGKGKNVYLIEFWATWCPPCIESIPHLTELQKKYKDKGLIVVGVAGPGKGETLKAVQKFVERRGDNMAYTVGYDGASETSNRYMGGVGASGIPMAFVIDREGAITWYGHPGNGVMDEIIDQVIKGTYNKNDAVMQEKLGPLFQRLNQYHSARDWSAFESTAKTILGMDPKNESAIGAMVYVYMFETSNAEGLRSFVDDYVSTQKTNAVGLNTLARALLGIVDLDKRQPSLALRAATAAYEACKGGDCATVDTYAQAVFEIGLVDRAIQLQGEAIALASDAAQKAALEKVAEYYKACKALQSEKL